MNMNKRNSILFVFLIFCMVFGHAQSRMIQMGSTGFDGINDAVVDANFTYVTGYFGGRLKGLKSHGDIDAFVAKLDSEGAMKWINQIGSNFKNKNEVTESGDRIAVASDGSVYATGLFYGKLEEDQIISKGRQDIFIVKYNSKGEKLWIKSIGSNGDESIDGFVLDKENNIYIVASLNGDRLNNEYEFEKKDDILIFKYNSDGNEVWSSKIEQNDKSIRVADMVSSSESTILLIKDDKKDYILSYGKYDNSKSKIELPEERHRFVAMDIDTEDNLYLLSDNIQAQVESKKKKSKYEILKMNTAGDKVWDVEYSSKLEYVPKDIIMDSEQLHVVGEFQSNGVNIESVMNFGNGSLITNHNLTQGDFINEYFILGRNQNIISKVFLENESISFAGQFYNEIVFGSEALASKGKTDGFILKASLDEVREGFNDDFQQIIVHPNPNLGEFFVTLQFLKGDERIELFDLMGRLVYKGDLFPEEKIDIKSLSTGIYVLNIYRGEEKIRSFKIIKKDI